MKLSAHDPRRLDVAELARQGDEIRGEWPLDVLPRLAEMNVDVPGEGLPPVRWVATGEARPVLGGEPEIWLHLQAEADVRLACQRCLGPVRESVAVDRSIRFVRGEAQAAELDADSEDDVLALERWTDLGELIEDELLLALPLVPRHDQCPAPLPLPADDEPAEQPERPNPFAVLAQLKKTSG